MRKSLFFLLIGCFLFWGCSSSNNMNQNAGQAHATPGKKTNQIVFINLRIFKTGNTDSVNAELLSVDMVPGTVKDQYSGDTIPAAGYLSLTISNKENKLIKKIIFENPLEKSVEFVNSKNEFERKIVSSNEEKISFRLQYNPDFYYLSIDKIAQNLNFQTIYKTKLEGENEN